VAIRTTPDVEGSSVVRTVRELLDNARACENTDVHAARAMAQQARVLARTLDDARGEAEALYRLASIAYTAGQSNDAFAIALDARELARNAGAPVLEVWTLNLVGLVQYDAGNFAEALESALAALDLYRLTGERVDEGNLLNTIAIIHHSLPGHVRGVARCEQGPRPCRLRRAGAAEHGRGSCSPERVPARDQPGRAGPRAQP